MSRSSLCDYSYGYILASGIITITVVGADDAERRVDERKKEQYLKIVRYLLTVYVK